MISLAREHLASLRRLASSEFSRNVSFLASGTAISMGVTVLASPITTRLYQPADYGVFALFITIAAVVGVVATGQYAQAIILPKSDRDATDVVGLCLAIALAVGIFVAIVVLLFASKIALLAGNATVANWL